MWCAQFFNYNFVSIGYFHLRVVSRDRKNTCVYRGREDTYELIDKDTTGQEGGTLHLQHRVESRETTREQIAIGRTVTSARDVIRRLPHRFKPKISEPIQSGKEPSEDAFCHCLPHSVTYYSIVPLAFAPWLGEYAIPGSFPFCLMRSVQVPLRRCPSP